MAEGAGQPVTQSISGVLEMMHPMREPPQPASLAPVLFTLVVGIAVALLALALLLRARRRRADLREAARAALARTRGLDDAERLAGQAALLRRLVRRLAGEDAARLQGAAWLGALDRAFATRFFTQGAGAAFGDALYGARVPDVAALDGELAALFGKLRARPQHV